jgi:tryptophan synthase alpha chain
MMSRVRGATAIRETFTGAQRSDRAALVAYLMAGYPDDATALEGASCALAAGADLLEVGVPFSDPVADGPVIAGAGRRALASGGGLDSGLRLIAALRDQGMQAPILAMSYLNPLVARGEDEALRALAAAGADGVIVPDLPVGEEPAFERSAADAGLALCCIVAPNTSPERLDRAIRGSTGFLYVVPLFGVTGARDRLAEDAVPLLRRVRAAAAGRTPVAAGFGIATPEQVSMLAAVADGVVVGSAVVSALDGRGPEGVANLVSALAAATHRSRQRATAAAH